MSYCLKKQLKESVNNNNLLTLNGIFVTLIGVDPYFAFQSKSKDVWSFRVKSGTLYSDSARTNVITGDFYTSFNYQKSYVYKEPNATVVLEFNKENICTFASNIQTFITTNSAGCAYEANINELKYYPIYYIDITEGRSNTPVKLEDLFLSMYLKIKGNADTSYEDASAKKDFPFIGSTKNRPNQNTNITFHNLPVSSKLFMATNLQSNTFQIYNTVSNYDSEYGYYNISNQVASCNATTGVWTYNS